MHAFHYSNYTTQFATNKHAVIGELALEAGAYVVFAKADVGTNVISGYPPPAWPHGGGAAHLKLGDSVDSAYATIKPESGDNIEVIALMVAARIERPRRARLYFSHRIR